jgi:hypothetical protein
MNTVKLYRIKLNNGYLIDERGVGWGMSEPVNTDYFEAEVLEEAAFELPEGYEVGETTSGEIAIFSPKNQYCHITLHSSGLPQLQSGTNESSPVLQRVTENELSSKR